MPIEQTPTNEIILRVEKDLEEMKDELPFSFRVLVKELIHRLKMALNQNHPGNSAT